MNYVENTLQGYEIMSYSKLRAIVLFQTIEITSKKSQNSNALESPLEFSEL